MRSPTWLTRAAFAAAVVGGVVAAFAPLGRECSVTSETARERCVGTSLFQTEGAWILVVVSVPVILALLPVLVRHRSARIVSAILLWACVVVAIFSVGSFFVPAVLMTIAASRRPTPAFAG